MARVLNPDGFRRCRMAAIVEAVNRRGWKWAKETTDGRNRLLLVTPGGRRFEFRLSAGAWIKERKSADTAQEGVAA